MIDPDDAPPPEQDDATADTLRAPTSAMLHDETPPSTRRGALAWSGNLEASR